MKVKSESEFTQLCPTLSNPMDCSLPGSSVHGIFQARVLGWAASAFFGAIQQVLIYFIQDNVHMSIPISPFIAPSPYPLLTISWLSMSITLFLFCSRQFIFTLFLDSTYRRSHMILVFLCLTYFTQCENIQVSHVAVKGIISFSFMSSNISLYIWMVILSCVYVPHLLYPFLC